MQKQFDSTLKIFPLFCYLEFDESYNEGDQREEGPFFAIVDLIIMVWLLLLLAPSGALIAIPTYY